LALTWKGKGRQLSGEGGQNREKENQVRKKGKGRKEGNKQQKWKGKEGKERKGKMRLEWENSKILPSSLLLPFPFPSSNPFPFPFSLFASPSLLPFPFLSSPSFFPPPFPFFPTWLSSPIAWFYSPPGGGGGNIINPCLITKLAYTLYTKNMCIRIFYSLKHCFQFLRKFWRTKYHQLEVMRQKSHSNQQMTCLLVWVKQPCNTLLCPFSLTYHSNHF